MADIRGGAGGSGSTVDWQQFYVPLTNTGMGAGGYTQNYLDEVNAQRMREAMLQAQQINQIGLQNQAMQTANAGASAQQQYQQELLSKLSSGGGGYGGGTGSLGGGTAVPLSGYSFGIPGSNTTILNGAGGPVSNVQSQEEQLRYDPWAAHRTEAGTQLANQMGQTNPADVYQQKLAEMATGTFNPNDPSYQFRFNQGQQAVERSLAARGLLNSGNAALELQNYGQQAASQEYGAQWQRMLQGLSGVSSAYDQQMNRLMQMAGVNINPTAGGELNVAQGQLGVAQGQLGVNASQVASNYDLGLRELAVKQQLANQALLTGGVGGVSGSNWQAIFGGGA